MENQIFDTNVAMYKKEGIVTIFTVIEHTPITNESFEIIFPEDIDYVKAIQISRKLREKGKSKGAIDILIAAMCLNRSAELLTKDKDFVDVKKIFPELKVKIENS